MKTIEEIRLEHGFSNQKEFAKELGISSRAYTNKITGVRDWKLSELTKIADMNDGEVKVNDCEVTIRKA